LQLLERQAARSQSKDDINISHTYDSTGARVEITGDDIRQFMDRDWKGPIDSLALDRTLNITCEYANETYGHQHLYCISLGCAVGAFLHVENFGIVSEYLRESGITRDTFYQTKYIFIPLIYEQGRPHVVLSVISPYHKTIEILDSESEESPRAKKHDDIFVHAMDFLSFFLQNKFIPIQWRIRRGASDQQDVNINDCCIAVIMNAMNIAFGYDIAGVFLGLFWGENDKDGEEFNDEEHNLIIKINTFVSLHKRKMAASELLHGVLEPYKNDDSDAKNPFAYQFGSHDYNKPVVQVRQQSGEIQPTTIYFVRLEDVPRILDRLNQTEKKPRVTENMKITRPTTQSIKAQKRQQKRRLRPIAQTLHFLTAMLST